MPSYAQKSYTLIVQNPQIVKLTQNSMYYFNFYF